MKAKYVVFDQGLTDFMVIFNPVMEHATMARMVNMEVISAGFVSLEGKTPICYGRSHSLDIGSKKGDTELAQQLLNFHE